MRVRAVALCAGNDIGNRTGVFFTGACTKQGFMGQSVNIIKPVNFYIIES